MIILLFFGFNYKDGSKLVAGGVYPEQYKGRTTLHLLEKQESEKAPAAEKISASLSVICDEIKKTVKADGAMDLDAGAVSGLYGIERIFKHPCIRQITALLFSQQIDVRHVLALTDLTTR